LTRLSPQTWRLSDFLRDAAHRWTGAVGEKEYADVDKKRAEGGFAQTTPPGVQAAERDALDGRSAEANGKHEWTEYRTSTGEKFGKEVREKYWSFEKGWVNLNHGEHVLARRPEANLSLRMNCVSRRLLWIGSEASRRFFPRNS